MSTDTRCTNCQALLAALQAILSLQEQHDGESFEAVFLHAEQIARDAIAVVEPT